MLNIIWIISFIMTVLEIFFGDKIDSFLTKSGLEYSDVIIVMFIPLGLLTVTSVAIIVAKLHL